METGTTPQASRGKNKKRPEIMLDSLETFLAHPWISALSPRFERDAALATSAQLRVIDDLRDINEEMWNTKQRVAFTTVEGRVKTKSSFLRKLYKICVEKSPSLGLTPLTLEQFYRSIKDLCGVRFSCPYFDEIEPSVALLRKRLSSAGYATNLQSEEGHKDKNYLEDGDGAGYRSYHFYMRVPTVVNIYGDVELCLCEVQARSELQHVWAVKSHDILYKRDEGWSFADAHVVQDMKHISNSLRAADQHLASVRDRVRRNGDKPNA